jgi:hypothetical protein
MATRATVVSPLLALALALVACTSDDAAAPPGASSDGGRDVTTIPLPTRDGGAADVSARDGAIPDATARETGVDDASVNDASVNDASVNDANVLDSTAPTDAGARDAFAEAEAAAPIVWPDAGSGCNPPTSGGGLSPTAAGLPASGLVLWLRGDTGVYTTAAADAGDASASTVCAWEDQSGKGWLFTPTTTTITTASAGIGGKAAVSFPASSAVVVSGVLGIGATSARTIIAVASLSTPTGRFHPFYQGQSGTPGTYLGLDSNTWQTAGSLEGVYLTNNSYDANTATTAAARLHVLTISDMTVGATASTAFDYRINGATQTMTLLAGNNQLQDFSGANFTAISSDPTSSTGVPGVGMVAELIAYDRALSLTEKQAVETALKARYAIP